MENTTWKIRNTTFNSEEDYKNALSDLKKIKALINNNDITEPIYARKLYLLLRSHPELLTSIYGNQFRVKLSKIIILDVNKQRETLPSQKANVQNNSTTPTHSRKNRNRIVYGFLTLSFLILTSLAVISIYLQEDIKEPVYTYVETIHANLPDHTEKDSSSDTLDETTDADK